MAEQLGDRIDIIIDGGKCPVGIESTVIAFAATPIILRPGGLPIEEIEKAIGKVEVSSLSDRPASPGQMPRHYSPKTPLKVMDIRALRPEVVTKGGLLAFTPPNGKLPFARIEVLSRTGDLKEAAANLFSALHALDTAGLEVIYAEPVPEVGLGRAIMDRLRKAETRELG